MVGGQAMPSRRQTGDSQRESRFGSFLHSHQIQRPLSYFVQYIAMYQEQMSQKDTVYAYSLGHLCTCNSHMKTDYAHVAYVKMLP